MADAKTIVKAMQDLGGGVTTLNSKIDTTKTDLETEINALKTAQPWWIKGEYKWMPIGSTMPAGWVKVAITDGFTLVAGTAEGTTAGDIKLHNHSSVNNIRVVASYKMTLNTANNNYAKNLEYFSPGWDTSTAVTGLMGGGLDVQGNIDINNTGNVNNLAAGKYAELWQYTG